MDLRDILKRKEYQPLALPDKPFFLDIVGIRRPGKINSFKDVIACGWYDEGVFCSREWPATTEPGLPWLLKLFNKKGTAILVSGRYEDSYQLGFHKNQEALIQVKPVSVYRDANKNSIIDLDSDSIDRGVFGINIHRAGAFSRVVGEWSAGCQVFQKEDDFEEFISLCENHEELYGNKFTYTLVEV